MEEFFSIKNIKNIFNSLYHPQNNGVVEVSYKKIRKNVLIYYANNPDNFNLKNALLDAVEIYNNIHTNTKCMPVYLLNNCEEEIYKAAIKNMNNSYKIKEEDYLELKEGEYVLIKKNAILKRLVKSKINIRDNKILATVTNNYRSGFDNIKIEENSNKISIGDELQVDYKLIDLISEKEFKF